MLIVHPSSTCDVCLDPYSWSTAANTPHAIACGHVFCLQCLMSTHPSLCPLCREAFSPERIKKLHIDRYAADDDGEPDETIQVNGFLQRIALVSGENTPEENVADVVSEVNRWLAARNEGHGLRRALRMSVDSLNRAIERGLENQTMREAIEQRHAEWERSYRRQEQDIRTSRLIEKTLLDQLEDYKLQLTHAKRTLEENILEMDRLQAEHAQLRAEVAKHRSKGGPSASVGQSNSSGSGRPPTSMSGRTQLSALTHGSRTSAMTRAISEPLTAIGMPATAEEEELPEVHYKSTKKPTRPPVVLPGASLVKKTVPSPPDSYITAHPGRRTPTFAGTQDPFSSSGDSYSSENDEVNTHRRGPPTISEPHYGYVPGIGYVPVAPPSVYGAEDDAAGQLVLYDPELSRSRDPELFVAQVGATTSLDQPEEIVPTTAWTYSDNERSRNVSASASSVNTYSPSGFDHYTSRPSASSSLSSLNLLAQPSSGIRTSAQTTPRQGTGSPEPSIASWGTVPSARTSRSTSIMDLQLTGLPAPVYETDPSSHPASLNSSFSDLCLTGLPNVSSRDVPLHEVARSDDSGDVLPTRAITWEGNVIPPRPEEGPYSVSASRRRRREAATSRPREDLDEVLTPRVRRISPEPISLGLSLSSSSSTSRHPTGAPDLNAVNQTLMRAHSDSRAAPRHAHFRVASMSDAEGSPRPSSRPNGSIDSVQIAVRPAAHGVNGVRETRNGPSTSTSRRNSFVVPHTDRISGPRQLPIAVQRSESHGDYNRQRRHSSLSFPYLTAGDPEDEISDRHARVTRDSALNGVHHAHVGARTQHENTRPASIYSTSGLSFSAPGGDALAASGSLGLSLAPPPGPGSSAAATSSGEPSTIRAPRPVNRSHSNHFFAAWDR